MIGVTLGWLLAARVSEDAVRLAIGVISIAFVAYMLIRDRLTDRGVMTMQAGMTKVNEVFFYGAVNRTLGEVFPVVAPYQGFISCFGTPWGFILASKGEDPRRQSAAEIDRLIAERLDPTSLGYWDGQAHLHSFNLPKFLRRAIETNDRVITDSNPLIVTRVVRRPSSWRRRQH